MLETSSAMEATIETGSPHADRSLAGRTKKGPPHHAAPRDTWAKAALIANPLLAVGRVSWGHSPIFGMGSG